MTLVVLILGGAIAFLWTYLVGWYVVGSLTVFVALFIATLATASFYAFRSGSQRSRLAALVLICNFALSHYLWANSGDPVLFHAVLNMATAGWFVFTAQERWEFGIGILYLLGVLAAVLTFFGVVEAPEARTGVFFGLSFPDLNAVIGHMANVTLGIGAGDSGLALRGRLRSRAVVHSGGYHLLARLGLAKTVEKEKAEG